MCIPYKKGIMQESHTYYLLSKYMDHTISTEELKTLRLLVNLSDDDELSLSLSHLWENGRPFEEVDERIIRDMFSGIQNRPACAGVHHQRQEGLASGKGQV